ncbi:MAG: TonB-dependent receptor [Ignavibacteriaceae bacterium]|nr:TonB-dependent receptor [Ignavibacteriaceae bacterium]
MKNLVILFLLFAVNIFPQYKLTGIIRDSETQLPLSNANLIIKNKIGIGTVSDEGGNFFFEEKVFPGDTLVISFLGYTTQQLRLTESDFSERMIIYLSPKILPSQTVLIQASVGRTGITPITFEKISRSEIKRTYTVQDIPQFLSQLQSVNFYSENGNGLGYNYLSIRGFDQRRISVSINGIPQNDPEDHNIYWLDFPDLLASTEMIQVQRGAGSGVFGYPAIGGSINIITSTFSNSPQVNISASLGGYNTRKYSAAYSSGLIGKKYSIYAKLSQILSSGYRKSSWIKFNAYHLSVVRYDENVTTQVNLFGGPIADGLAYTGVAKFAVKDKNLRKENYSYWEADENGYTFIVQRRPEEIENFSQPHYEILNEIKLSEKIILNSALFLVIGKGFFDYDGSWADTSYFRLTRENNFYPTGNPSNAIIRAQVENNQFGWIPRISFEHKSGKLIIGGELRRHRSDHWGAISYAENLPAGVSKNYFYYFYNGSKDIFNSFIHESYSLNEKIDLLGEIQFAFHKYRLFNEKYIGTDFSKSGFYINPRFGLNYKFNNSLNTYLSFARVTREPRLKDYYDAAESSGGALPQFELNADGSFNFEKPLVKPETMNNFELGSELQLNNLSVSLNLFYMLFKDEIVKNGKLDRFGQPITGNAETTRHAGVEVYAQIKPLQALEIFFNATYSQNKIVRGKYFDQSGASIDLSGNRISGFPDFMFNFGIIFLQSDLYLRLNGRYVGKFYSDNFDDNLKAYLIEFPGFVDYSDNINEEYFTADFYASYEFPLINSLSPWKIFLQVNNVLDNLYSAYAIGKEFFPAADRNWLVGIQVGL